MPRTVKLEVGETFEAEYIGLNVAGKYDFIEMRLDNGELVNMFVTVSINTLPKWAEDARKGGFRVRACLMRAPDFRSHHHDHVIKTYHWALGRYRKDELPPTWVWSRFVS